MDYFIIDVETAPLDFDAYKASTEEDRKKNFLNPVASKIVAIGLRHNNKNKVFASLTEEKEILEAFWAEWSATKRGNGAVGVVGFNICDFDMPMLVGRSFVHDVSISPFTLKELHDLRQKLSAYQYQPRGKLKEYATLIGLEVGDVDGSMVADLVQEGKLADLKTYLEKDLELTDAIFKRAENLNILKINRW